MPPQSKRPTNTMLNKSTASSASSQPSTTAARKPAIDGVASEQQQKRTIQMISAPPPTTTQTTTKRGRKKKDASSSEEKKKDLFIDTDVNTKSLTTAKSAEPVSTPTQADSTTPPGSKKKLRPTFAMAKIKRIIQADEDIGKIAAAVPVLVSRALELFLQDLVTRSGMITKKRFANTMTPAHVKECIESEERFDFLKNKVKNIQILASAEGHMSDGEGGDASTADHKTEKKKKGRKKKVVKEEEDEDLEEEEPKDEEQDEQMLPVVASQPTKSISPPTQQQNYYGQQPQGYYQHVVPQQLQTQPSMVAHQHQAYYPQQGYPAYGQQPGYPAYPQYANYNQHYPVENQQPILPSLATMTNAPPQYPFQSYHQPGNGQ